MAITTLATAKNNRSASGVMAALLEFAVWVL